MPFRIRPKVKCSILGSDWNLFLADRYTIFSSTEIIEHMAFIAVSYYSLQNESFASFSYDTSRIQNFRRNHELQAIEYAHIPPIELCIDRIADVKLENQTYVFDVTERTGKCRRDVGFGK